MSTRLQAWRIGWALPGAVWNAFLMHWLVDAADRDGLAMLLAAVVVTASFAPMLASQSRSYVAVTWSSAALLVLSGLVPVIGIAWMWTGFVVLIGLTRRDHPAGSCGG